MRHFKVDDLSEFLDVVNNLKIDWKTDELWFRGIENITYDLIPSLYRGKWKISIEEQRDLYADFVRKAKAFIPDYGKLKIFDWYILMQHYGFPTRLLDWTCGSLIALYFAVRNIEIDTDRCVYVIDPFNFNNVFHNVDEVFCCDEILRNDYERIVNYLPIAKVPEYPIAIEPPYFDKRIVAQKSCFTIHGNNRAPLNGLMANKTFKVAQIKISDSRAIEIKEELSSTGITESILFPDLEGLSRELIFHHIIE